MDYRILGSFWPILLYAVCETTGMVLAARVLLHFFQLESYQFQGYFKTVARQWSRACAPGAILAVGFVLPFCISVAAPVITEGDVMGAVLFVAPHGAPGAGEVEYKLAQTAAAFLGRQMES